MSPYGPVPIQAVMSQSSCRCRLRVAASRHDLYPGHQLPSQSWGRSQLPPESKVAPSHQEIARIQALDAGVFRTLHLQAQRGIVGHSLHGNQDLRRSQQQQQSVATTVTLDSSWNLGGLGNPDPIAAHGGVPPVAVAPVTDDNRGVAPDQTPVITPQSASQPAEIQRTLGDGHDLTSPRFSQLLELEAAYDNERIIKKGASGRGVQAIQQALYDLGFRLKGFGADGAFGPETDQAVRQYQRSQGLSPDGKVGPLTMTKLDQRFPAVKLPKNLKAKWTWPCVRDLLCPWSPHTVNVLQTYTVKSFDNIFWDDEKWDGKAWVVDPFPGGGYHRHSAREIGLLNNTCERVAETLYHEVLHAEQPTSHTTTQDEEGYAYRIGEEFSIAMGLSGRPALRSNDPQGREFADKAKVDASVAAKYPSVGPAGEEIIGHAPSGGADVEVRRPDGSIYVRPANIGEKVPGPIRIVNEATHDTSKWAC